MSAGMYFHESEVVWGCISRIRRTSEKYSPHSYNLLLHGNWCNKRFIQYSHKLWHNYTKVYHHSMYLFTTDTTWSYTDIRRYVTTEKPGSLFVGMSRFSPIVVHLSLHRRKSLPLLLFALSVRPNLLISSLHAQQLCSSAMNQQTKTTTPWR